MLLRKRCAGLLVVAGSVFPLAAMCTDAVVEMYPKRPITIVVGFPPGGGADFIARHLSKILTQELGQKVLVDNRAGAGGNIGAISVARAKPDGYTLYLASRSAALHRTLYKSVEYDFSRDFVPVAMITRVPYVLVAGAQVTGKNLREVTEFCRAKGDAVTLASGAIGSPPHLISEALRTQLGLQWIFIPYKGDTPALLEVISGRADFAVVTAPSALPHLTSHGLRAVALFSKQRIPALGAAELVTELGFGGAEVSAWFAVVAPVGAPSYAIDRLNYAINKALANRELSKKLSRLGYMVPAENNTPEALQAFIEQDTAEWSEILESRPVWRIQ